MSTTSLTPTATWDACKAKRQEALKWLRNGAQPTDRVQTLLKLSGAWEEFEASKSKAK